MAAEEVLNKPSYRRQGGRSEPRGPCDGGRSVVRATQRILMEKHHEAKSKIEGVGGAGGGVSMWPAMDDMRLSRGDAMRLVRICVVLVMVTMTTFYWLHGTHLSVLRMYTSEIRSFSQRHPVSVDSGRSFRVQDGQEAFDKRVLQWHRDLLELMTSVRRDLNVNLSTASLPDLAFVLLYIVGVVTLLYFLLDNMFSKSRLTPRRIKVWVSLLAVVYAWTVLMAYWLVCIQSLETVTQDVVHSLTEELGYLVQTELDLTRYHSILLYWQTRHLPPTARGVLSVMGLLQAQDVTYYLQYYSLPVLTALCTPVVKIVLSLWTVYRQPKYIH